MAIDASIYSQIQQPQIQDPLNALAKVTQLQNAQNQNKLFGMQVADRETERAGTNALNSAYQSAYDPTTGQIDRNKLYQSVAQSGQGSKLPIIQKGYADQDKASAEAEKSKLGLALEKQKAVAQVAGSVRDQATWDQGLQYLQSIGVDIRQVPRQYDPATAAMLRDRAMSGAEQLAQVWKQKDFDYKQTNDAANRGITMRGQNMTDARSRETLGQGKIPAGYRQTADGNLEAIQGGPADLKLQGALNQDTSALNSGMSAMDRLAVAANEALKSPGLAGTTGVRGMIPNVPGTDAADAAALLGTLKSQVAFGVLQDMRNNSKTGGALGQVSDKEGKLLESNLAALDKSQSIDQLKSSLQKIIDYTEASKGRLRAAYNLKHSNVSPSAPEVPAPKVRDSSHIDSLLDKYK